MQYKKIFELGIGVFLGFAVAGIMIYILQVSGNSTMETVHFLQTLVFLPLLLVLSAYSGLRGLLALVAVCFTIYFALKFIPPKFRILTYASLVVLWIFSGAFSISYFAGGA